jgi:hypothetical protein
MTGPHFSFGQHFMEGAIPQIGHVRRKIVRNAPNSQASIG